MPVLCQCPRWKSPGVSIPITVRHYSSAAAAPPKRRVWVRLAVVTLAAAGIGAYVRSRQESPDAHLNPASFARYRLMSREPVSSTNSIFTVEPASPVDNRETYELAWQTGVWSVMFKQPQLQIGRDYTPLPPREESDEAKDSLRFLIRRDPHGEVSRYLHRLQEGSEVEIRGPQVECEISPDVNNILFIAGGTGIAPALQAAYIMLRRTMDGKNPRIHILWANRKREDCAGGISDTTKTVPSKSSWWPFRNDATPSRADRLSEPSSSLTSSVTQGAIVRELQDLKARYPGQITVDYFVDEENSFISTKEIRAYIESVQSSSADKRMVIISGPEGFINYMAGPKVWAHGYELQGPVKGILQQLGLTEWEIWKL